MSECVSVMVCMWMPADNVLRICSLFHIVEAGSFRLLIGLPPVDSTLAGL